MTIKRYFAIADNTITNAYKENLITRGTGSNMGQADILEVFSIYGQATTSSAEASRVLLQFNTTSISSDRTAGTIPTSGSVKFYLNMFNAPHAETLPVDYTLTVSAVSQSWEEGYGLDMETYSDLTHDSTGSNWIKRGTLGSWSTAGGDYHASPTFEQTFTEGYEDLSIDVTSLVEQWIAESKNNYGFGVQLSSSQESTNRSFFTKKFFARSSEYYFDRPVLEARWEDTIKDDRGVFYASSSLAPATDNLNTLYIYNRIRGRLRDIPTPPTSASLRASATGTNLYTAAVSKESTGVYKTDLFLETTSSTLYDVWHRGSKASVVLTFGSGIPSNGTLGITFGEVGAFTLTFDNTAGSTDADIGTDKAATIDPSAEIDSAGNAQRVLLLLRDGVTGDGIKNAYDFAYDGSSAGAETVTITSKEEGSSHSITVTESLSNLSSTVTAGSITAYHTGTISVKSFEAETSSHSDKYILKISDAKNYYKNDGFERFRLYVRPRNWSPNIYTVAKSTPETTIIHSASYEVFRIMDNKLVVPHGTGSTLHTLMSYDIEGNYFDLDMDMLEAGYDYGIRFSFYDDYTTSWKDQSYEFRFKVRQNEY